MVSFLSGLGALGGGLTQGLGAGADLAYKRKARQREETAYQEQTGGRRAFMNAFLGGSGQPPVEPQMQPGQPSAPMQLPGGQPGGVASLIQSEAAKRGIDPSVALRVAQSEGLGSYTGDHGSSFGPFQLHYGGVAPGGNRVPGLGDEFTKTTGLDARDPRTVPQQIAFALDRAKEGGWGPWHGWKGDPRAGLPGSAPQPQQAAGGGDWRSFAQRILQANPGIGQGEFFEAMQIASPFMSMESKREMAQLRAQMQGFAESQKNLRADKASADRRYAADIAYKGKIDTANIGAQSRQEVANTMREGRMDVAQMQDATKRALATITDTRLRDQMKQRSDALVQKYEFEREKLGKLLADKEAARGVQQEEFYDKLAQAADEHNKALESLNRHREAMEQLGLLGINTRAATAREAIAARTAAKSQPSALERRQQTAATGAIAQIDDALDMLQRTQRAGYTVTGAEGFVRRKGLEFLQGLGDPAHARTEAKDWEQQIEALKLQIPRVLTGVGRVSKGERDRIDAIVGGLSALTNPAQIKSELERLKGIIKKATGLPEPTAGEQVRESPSPGVVPAVKSDEEYNALPSGAVFMDPQGNRRRKP